MPRLQSALLVIAFCSIGLAGWRLGRADWSPNEARSALEIHRFPQTTRLVAARPVADTTELVARFQKLSYWIRNDLYSHPIHLFDLPLYRVTVVDEHSPPPTGLQNPLLTAYPDELYEPPLPIVRSLVEG